MFVSDKPAKKYYALVNGRKVYFGDAAYQHYHDKLGHWKHLDHGDKRRRDNYLKRTASQKKEAGTAAWFASEVLW